MFLPISQCRRGQERVKKCTFAISTESALENLSSRTLVSDDRDVGIYFGSPAKFPRSISSYVPDGTFPGACLTYPLVIVRIF